MPTSEEIRWPLPGDSLVHRFRRQPGEVVAEVLTVDRVGRTITVRVQGKVYNSLSAAAKSVSGYASNGWVYWGLKRQVTRLTEGVLAKGD